MRRVEREADPHNLAPTASAVTALALGHALAIALMCARNFTPEEFGRFHPGGQLGRNLRLSVAEAMHSGGRGGVRGAGGGAEGRDHRDDAAADGRGVRGRPDGAPGGLPHGWRLAAGADESRRHPRR